MNVPLPGPGAIAARRPIPQLSQFNTIRWDGWATYNALTLAAKRRFTSIRAGNLMFDANWTWSHSIDDASDPGTTLNETNLPQNVYDMAAEKASSSFDHRQRFVVSFVYQLPTPSTPRSSSLQTPLTKMTRASARPLAGRRELHRAIGRAVHREYFERPGQYRIRTRPASQHLGQPECRSQDAE